MEIEKSIGIYIIAENNFKYEFLIGMALMIDIKQCQDENLMISQWTWKWNRNRRNVCRENISILKKKLRFERTAHNWETNKIKHKWYWKKNSY